MRGRDDLADVLGCDLAVVDRDGEALVLHPYSRNRRQVVAQFGGGALEDGHGRGGLVVLVVGTVGSGQLEPVAAGVPDAGYADPVADVGEVATAQDGHRMHATDELQAPRRRRRRAWPRRDRRRSARAFRRSRDSNGSRAPVTPTS